MHNTCGSQYYKADGRPNWSENNGFAGEPTNTVLEPGTRVDRYGGVNGSFVSPEGTPYTQRSLPAGYDKLPYHIYEVVESIEVQSGKIAPWFGEEGGGIQHLFYKSIEELLKQGILKEVFRWMLKNYYRIAV